MRNIFMAIAMFAMVTTASAQGLSGVFGKLFGGSSSNSSDVASTVTNVLGSLLGEAVPFSEKLLEGTWNYSGTACVLESDAALADIGGTIVAEKVEKKLDGYLAKVGVKENKCSFTFIGNDSCVFKVGKNDISGNYVLDAEQKKIVFYFYGGLSFTTHVAYNVTSMNIVFDADKLLTLIKTVSSKVASSAGSVGTAAEGTTLGTASATLGVISSLLDSYDGMMLGMKLKK